MRTEGAGSACSVYVQRRAYPAGVEAQAAAAGGDTPAPSSAQADGAKPKFVSARKAWADVPPEVLNREYSFEDAMGVIKQFAAARFDESVDIVVKLGIDTKRPDQHVRGVSYLPHNPGKPMRVAVFAEQDWVSPSPPPPALPRPATARPIR